MLLAYGGEKHMWNVLLYVFIFLMAVMGGVSTIVVLAAVPVVLISKIYRKIRYGCKLTD